MKMKLAERILVDFIHSGELEIDEHGNVWRLKIRRGRKNGGVSLIPTRRRRAENRTPTGYLQVRISIDGHRYYVGAHRLVWQYFVGDIPDGMAINHKNGIKSDNRLSNLEVVTYSKNTKHAYRTGLKSEHGEKNPNSILSDQQVTEIRELYATGDYKQIELAEIFAVTFQTISKIVRGKTRCLQGGPIDKSDHRDYAQRDPETGRFCKFN